MPQQSRPFRGMGGTYWDFEREGPHRSICPTTECDMHNKLDYY